MPIHKTDILVLRTFDFRETSMIATFFTRDFGKLQGILKGIRADQRKFSSTLEPFSHNEIVFYRKKSDLHLVSACDLKNNFPSIRQDMARCGHASFMMELLDAVTSFEDKHEEIFDLAITCLSALNDSALHEKVPTIFKIKALSLSGFKPYLNSCVCCNNRIVSQSRFSTHLGGLLCPACFGRDVKANWIFRGTIASIMHIERNDLHNSLRLGLNPQVKRELDYILSAFIEFHLDKRFKTQRVLPYLSDERSARTTVAR